MVNGLFALGGGRGRQRGREGANAPSLASLASPVPLRRIADVVYLQHLLFSVNFVRAKLT